MSLRQREKIQALLRTAIAIEVIGMLSEYKAELDQFGKRIEEMGVSL